MDLIPKSNGGIYTAKVLEDRRGLVVAAVLAVLTAALVAAEWFLLPDEVVVQFGSSGAHYGSKTVMALVSAGLGLGGAGWLAYTRLKIGLLLSVVGVGLAAVVLFVNLALC